MRPGETRFGPCAPRIDAAIEALSALWGETIVPCGGSAAQPSGPDHPESRPRGLSHLRPQPEPVFRGKSQSNCATHPAGNWRPHVARRARPSAPSPGLARTKSKRVSKRFCLGFPAPRSTSSPPRARSCPSGWRNRSARTSRMPETPYQALSADDRRDALRVAEGSSPHRAFLLEKDIWVVATLHALFDAPFGNDLAF